LRNDGTVFTMFISEADVDGVDMTGETPLLSNLQAEIYVLRVQKESETCESISTAKGLAAARDSPCSKKTPLRLLFGRLGLRCASSIRPTSLPVSCYSWPERLY
jgi:hypothetical protein